MKLPHKVQMYTLPNGRVCHHYGHTNSAKHVMVTIPLTQAERRNSRKSVHFQSVRVSNLKPVQERRLVLA